MLGTIILLKPKLLQSDCWLKLENAPRSPLLARPTEKSFAEKLFYELMVDESKCELFDRPIYLQTCTPAPLIAYF